MLSVTVWVLRYLKLQRPRQLVNKELLEVCEQLEGANADKFKQLKDHLQKKSKLFPDDDDLASDSEDEDMAQDKFADEEIEVDDVGEGADGPDGPDGGEAGGGAVAHRKKNPIPQTPDHWKVLLPGNGTLAAAQCRIWADNTNNQVKGSQVVS